jgi:hypothetical protein
MSQVFTYDIATLIELIESKPCLRDKTRGYVNEMGGERSAYREKRGVYRFLAGKPEGKKPLGRPRRRWKDNTKMDLQDVLLLLLLLL